MLEIGFYLLLNAFRVYILYRFSKLFFKEESQKKWLPYGYITIYIANSVGYLVLNNDTVNLMVNIGGLLLIILLGYIGSIKRKLLLAVAGYGMNLLTEDMAWVIFVKGRSEQMMEFGFFFSVFLFFLLEIFLEKCFDFRKKADIPLYKNLLLVLIPVGSMFISTTLIEGTYSNKILLVVSWSILLLINIAVFYLFEKMQDDYSKQKEKEMYIQQLAMYQNQLKIMQSANDAYKAMRHDMKHHMILIADYIAKDEKDKVLQYFGKINDYVGNGDQYIETGNESIDSIFNYITGEVNKIGGTINTDIKVAEAMNIDDFDINVILSNLLFNACEAIRKCEEKKIWAVMRYDRGALTVKVSNTYNGVIKKTGENFLSTKPQNGVHGIGLANVRKTVEKYSGEMSVDYTDKEFIVKILIYI